MSVLIPGLMSAQNSRHGGIDDRADDEDVKKMDVRAAVCGERKNFQKMLFCQAKDRPATEQVLRAGEA